MNWPWKSKRRTACPVVVWDGEEGRLWAQAGPTEGVAARHWFWQEREQPLPADLLHTDMHTIGALLPCGLVRWHLLTLPRATEEEKDQMAEWEMAERIGPEDDRHWIRQSLPAAVDAVMSETVAGVVRREVLERIRTVLPQGTQVCKIVPEEVAIGCALPCTDARVLHISESALTVLVYRQRLPVEVRSVQDESFMRNPHWESELPWYVVADTEAQHRLWQDKLQAQSWPAVAHADYLTAGGERYERYPQIVLGASQAARGRLCWTQTLSAETVPWHAWHERRSYRWAAIALGMAGLCLAGVGGYRYQTSDAVYQQTLAVERSRESERQELAALQAAEQVLQERQRVRNIWSKLLLIIADSKPPGVYLTAILEDGERIVLKGICLQPEALQEWKEYLRLRLQRHATVKYIHTEQQSKREFQMVLADDEEY